ncbi:MAG: bifunctional acetate--CoA ligase family protein/GNAT family N-acetyltransferase [Candidatus Thiodiazotropha sp. (ex Lucina aurantia)]|uniref:Bifunctional acetate--CoA ligase family protein/GNAT family N-acetyltransferase n=1 Tax=Candidatus Thiodiazotropha taylori TaxID=2792791 RepID=A0A9E4NJQ9_9GAMM|nr:bifunctional acetate--CoA ligase family protein/GNAT family N-acetyltransferase [Candidatus Thiodiazotropha sp. (ex Lucina pensylvanica)]MBT3017626.1 bifunctional acetate--CoA ligase family protein/GNAT family N-acetyltransferase [Candidatus Thiodiazotropha taylori]MBT3039731.1 bifunctional acetate--CoA ligase family protein/GNAT family N-acetyltransferase [Candidatus Thiodiazotropha sp. (ex Codakia orbicularis)]MBV2104726.1 bifunctional acetate--CoA ligase family protein/GNAT family N-acetyl
MQSHYLTSLFSPKSIAMFGASDRKNSVGEVVFKNLISSGFKGDIYPINLKHDKVQGIKAYKSIEAIIKPVELAVVATPAKTIPAIVQACGEHGVKTMIILSAGFRESGTAGRRLEDKIVELAKDYGMRFIGPNCLGLIRPDQGINITFGNNNAAPGNLALVSQSGAICTAILDWAEVNDIGFSTVISTGIGADLDFGDYLDFLVSDPMTDSILLYVEGIKDARRFMSGLRAAARIKPVIVLKVGRHAAGAEASMSHTGALVGSDETFSAALSRSGVLRVETISQLFSAAKALSSRYRVYGDRLAIITNGGGPGVMAADRASDLNIELAELNDQTIDALNKVLPDVWSHGNPVDIIGDAPPERYRAAVDICLNDPGVDGTIVILTPQAMTEPEEVARALIDLADSHKKPILTSWMGGKQIETARKLFKDARLPSFRTLENAVDAFSYLSSYQKNQRLLLQTPAKSSRRHIQPDTEGARLIIESALSEQRKILTEPESFALLGAFRINAVRNGIARSANEALILAESIGFPVAMKIYSPDISHKSDAGGIRLNISNAQVVRSTYRDLIEQVKETRPEANVEGVTVEQMYQSPNGRELLIGIVRDPVFGPVISFGSGGTAVEVMGDSAIALPPLNRSLASDLIDRTKAAKLLSQFRHMPPANREALIDVLLRVSTMACELPWIREMDINPLIVDDQGAVAVDARIRVDFPRPSTDPYHHLAIHPYPVNLVNTTQLPNGTNIVIRPIRPEDADLEQTFTRQLSDEAKYFRFMSSIQELTPEMLTRFTQIDYHNEMALIAVTEDGNHEIELGVARYVINPDKKSCEFALVVSDQWQRQGIGHKLMHQLMEVARDRGLEKMEGEVLSNNFKMLDLMKSLYFHISTSPDDNSIKQVVIDL